jgi:hypothetical protein
VTTETRFPVTVVRVTVRPSKGGSAITRDRPVVEVSWQYFFKILIILK